MGVQLGSNKKPKSIFKIHNVGLVANRIRQNKKKKKF